MPFAMSRAVSHTPYKKTGRRVHALRSGPTLFPISRFSHPGSSSTTYREFLTKTIMPHFLCNVKKKMQKKFCGGENRD